MSLLSRTHERYIHRRRVRILCETLDELIPRSASVLDVGCGDGLLTSLISERRPDVEMKGIDVLVRNKAHIPVSSFDGSHIPFGDQTFDVVMFIDVLHHTADPMILLREGARVARKVLIKDHLLEGLFAGQILRWMDMISNASYGVALPYNYWREAQWQETFEVLNLRPSVWHKDLRLYPGLANWILGRSLHFIGCLESPI